MSTSIHTCYRPMVWQKSLLTALIVVLCTPLLDVKIVLADSTPSLQSYHLTDTINFKQVPQCIPQTHSLPYYNPYNSIPHRSPIRPLSFQQQIAMLTLFDSMGITEHQNNLSLMVDMTQYKNLSKLTQKQFEQATDWRQLEGEISHETACQDNSQCKDKASMALSEMGMYAALLPKWQHYDYTIVLGGSIQEMQLRMLILLSLYDSSLQDEELDLGEIVALTCDRTVLDRETDDRPSITMFDVNRAPHSGLATALINDEQQEILTETTGFQAIFQGLKVMSKSPEYFARFKETSSGYHPTLPVDFLSRNSFESKLYKKQGHTFQLDAKLPGLLEEFFQRYPDPEIVETKIQIIGELKKRPTTKQTVKEWLAKHNNELSCKDPSHCKILAISNAPTAFYQHIAVLQGLEESITKPTDLIYELSTAGSAVSINIPTDTLLDNITKLLYLELKHPKN